MRIEHVANFDFSAFVYCPSQAVLTVTVTGFALSHHNIGWRQSVDQLAGLDAVSPVSLVFLKEEDQNKQIKKKKKKNQSKSKNDPFSCISQLSKHLN